MCCEPAQNPVVTALAKRLEQNDRNLTTLSTRRLPLWNLKYPDVECLLRALPMSTSVVHLDLELMPEKNDCDAFGKCLSEVSCLHTLTVTSWNYGGWQMLCRGLKNGTGLEHLILGDCRMDAFEDTMDAKLLVRAIQNSTIQALTIQGMTLTPETVEELSSLSLREVTLNQIETDPGSWGLLLHMNICKLAISSCDLGLGWPCSGMSVNEHPLYKLMERNTIKHLEIVSCGLSNYEVAAMARGSRLGNTALEVLDLSDNDVTTGVYLGQLVRNCRGVRKVNISENPLSCRAWKHFCVSIAHHGAMEDLRMQNTAVEAADASVARFISHTMSSLPHLKLLDISEHAWGDHCDAAVFSGLCTHNSLRVLSLRGCRMDGTFLSKLLSLTPRSKLRALDWSRNSLSIPSPTLCRTLQNSSLRRLDLSSCGITDDVMADLAPAVCRSKLKDVSLGVNQIGNHGCGVLAGFLQSSTRLQSLDLALNPIDCGGLASLVSSLENNVTLRRLSVLKSQSVCTNTRSRTEGQGESERSWQKLTDEMNHLLRLNRAGRGFVTTDATLLPHLLQRAMTEYGENGLYYQLCKSPALLLQCQK